jgi:hypothetical protein
VYVCIGSTTSDLVLPPKSPVSGTASARNRYALALYRYRPALKTKLSEFDSAVRAEEEYVLRIALTTPPNADAATREADQNELKSRLLALVSEPVLAHTLLVCTWYSLCMHAFA